MADTILIKDGIIITLGESPRVLYNNSILIEDGKITKIDETNNFTGKYTRVINADGKVVMPGFINAHMHFYSTLVRGLGKAKPSNNFTEVLENLWWRLDKLLTNDTTYYSALIMLLSAIRHGTTTLIDHHASPKAINGSLSIIAKAVKETGLRASLCYEVSDRDGAGIANEGLKENSDFIKYCMNFNKHGDTEKHRETQRENSENFMNFNNHGDTEKHRETQRENSENRENRENSENSENNDEQLKALFGLHASFTVSDKTIEKARELAEQYNAGFHIHVAEAESDQIHCLQTHGLRVVERLDKFGILGNKSIAAHCVHINEKEMDILAENGTAVVHNPQSNLNNAVGIADIIKMQEKGILVGIGTDAMTVKMLEELRVALWAQHIRNVNPSCGFMESANTLLRNNSIIAGRYWNVPLGQITEGGAADIVLIDYIPPTPLDENTYLGHIIFGISQATVDTTIANGKILMEKKILKLNIDEEEISRKVRELTVALWNKF